MPAVPQSKVLNLQNAEASVSPAKAIENDAHALQRLSLKVRRQLVRTAASNALCCTAARSAV